MAFRELDEFIAVEPIVLPFGGKQYEFHGEISAKAWLQLQRIGEAINKAGRGEEVDEEEQVFSDSDQSGLMREILGDGERQMVEDGCTSSQIKRAFYTLIAYHLNGQETAEAVWESSAGEAPAPNRETRRAALKSAPTSARSRGSRAGSTHRADD